MKTEVNNGCMTTSSEAEVLAESDSWRLFVRLLVKARRYTDDDQAAVTAAMAITRVLNGGQTAEGNLHNAQKP